MSEEPISLEAALTLAMNSLTVIERSRQEPIDEPGRRAVAELRRVIGVCRSALAASHTERSSKADHSLELTLGMTDELEDDPGEFDGPLGSSAKRWRDRMRREGRCLECGSIKSSADLRFAKCRRCRVNDANRKTPKSFETP